MRFQTKSGSIARQKTACLILPVYSNDKTAASTRSVDRATGGLVGDALERGVIRGRLGDVLPLQAPDGQPFDNLLLVGCGHADQFDRKAFRRATANALRALRTAHYADAISALVLENARGTDPYRRARLTIEAWHDTGYRFTAMKSEDKAAKISLKTLGLACRGSQQPKVREGIRHGDAIGNGLSFAKDLGNLPANVCTPTYLAQQARQLARGKPKLRIEVLDEAQMKKHGMGSLLSVTAGTAEPAKMIVLHYNGGRKNAAPQVLVGKGVTFDAGGISIKPALAMDEMKYDMCGASTVLGVFRAVTELNLRLNLVGIIPAVENLPSGTATKPGDIVTSMSGKTIEVLNTDAEGRLILCDALTYAKRFKPAALVDIATLTGACLAALGKHRSGLLSNSDKLARALFDAGETADDGAWRLPMDREYQDLLKSNFADFANIGGRFAGTITAACFLSRFVEDIDWAHLDIAGTAWQVGPEKGSTGRPVPMLMEYLLNQ